MALTATVRATKPTVGGDTGLWGGEINNDLDAFDESINQSVTVNIADTNISLLADGSTGDQARYARYSFTGALTADRTVTLPASQKIGWASNNTSGGHNVILSAGGTTLKIAGSGWTFFQCDGTNVTSPSVGGTATNDNASAGSVGEFQSATAGPTSVSSSVATNIVTLSLTPGDWDINGQFSFAPSASATQVIGSISTTSATITNGVAEITGTVGNATTLFSYARVSIASTTTVYGVAQASFVSGTVSATASLFARRAR